MKHDARIRITPLAPPPSSLALTARELRIIGLVASGLKNREVGAALGTTEYMIKNYLRLIYDKLGLWNRVELALWHEFRAGGLEPELKL